MVKRVIMAVGAHADDIELNAGGTLVKYKEEHSYDIVYVMSTNNMSGGWNKILPDGTRTSRIPSFDEIMPQRKLEAGNAARRFGTDAIHLEHPQRHYMSKKGETVELRYGCERPDCVPLNTPTILTAHEDKNCVKTVTDLILKYKPEAVITHGPVMVDMEHLGTTLLITKAFRKAIEAGHDGVLLHWLDITPNIFGERFQQFDTFIDISKYQSEKIKAVGIHACQMPAPEKLDYPDWKCGCRYAEAFTICGRANLSAEKGILSAEILKNVKTL